MKRIYALLLACLLLPAAALAVTEGVVEAAPEVAIELPAAEGQEHLLIDEAYLGIVKELENDAIEAACYLLGSPDDLRLTQAEAPVWYSSARLLEDGYAAYSDELHEGIRLTLERKGKSVARRIKVLFDLQTKMLISLDCEYMLKLSLGDAADFSLLEDDTAVHMSVFSVEHVPGCEGIQMRLSENSDAQYAILHGMTGYGWLVEVTFDRAAHSLVRLKLLRDDHSASLAEMKE